MNALKKIALLLLIVIANTEIASATSLIRVSPPDTCLCCPDSLIGYTDVQDARCLECMTNRLALDSNITDLNTAITAKEIESNLLNEKLGLCTDLASKQAFTITKLEKIGKWLRVALGAVVGIAIFEAILLISK